MPSRLELLDLGAHLVSLQGWSQDELAGMQRRQVGKQLRTVMQLDKTKREQQHLGRGTELCPRLSAVTSLHGKLERRSVLLLRPGLGL